MEPMERWGKEKKLYKRLNKYIAKIIKDELKKNRISANVQSRIKEDVSLRRKLLLKGNTIDAYNSIHDKSGIRIVCNYLSELDLVYSIVKNNFHVVKYEDKRKPKQSNWIGYQAIHVDVIPKKSDSNISNNLKSLISEIQIKTALQTAWGENTHDLTYKNEVLIPNNLKRRVNLLNAMIEVADHEFDEMYHIIEDIEEISEFYLLFLLDDIFNKFFHVNYNVNFTISFIKKFHEYYKNKYDAKTLKSELYSFVESNYETINYTFLNRIPIGDEELFHKQPELILIYFSLVHDKYLFMNKWENFFNIEDLRTISTWFGVSLN